MDGPRYAVHGPDPAFEATLEFQEFADLLEEALREPRPNLERIRPVFEARSEMVPSASNASIAGNAASTGVQPAPSGMGAARGPAAALPMSVVGARPDVVFTFAYHMVDRGTRIDTYPLYMHRHGYARYPGRVYRYRSWGYAGTAVDTVHLGFVHGASLIAWIPDPSQPAGRRVLWEGAASLVADEPDLRAAMPYLAVSLAALYGHPTDGPTTVKFKRDDDRIEHLTAIRNTAAVR
ncbi:MAG: hypothetical protein AMXMBFR13_39620 [Phycisphaerae bacterium]